MLDRSARWILALRPFTGFLWMLRAGAAVVRGDRRQVGHGVLHRRGRPRHAGESDERAGGARRAARLLPAAVLCDLLAGRGAGRACRAARLAGAARAGRAVSAGLARAVMDRVRSRDDQAAALRAAALSGDRDLDRRHSRAWRPRQEPLDRARHRRLVLDAGADRRGCRCRVHLFRPRPRPHRLAVRRRRGGLRPVRLVALRRRRRRALAAARHGGVGVRSPSRSMPSPSRRCRRCSRAR